MDTKLSLQLKSKFGKQSITPYLILFGTAKQTETQICLSIDLGPISIVGDTTLFRNSLSFRTFCYLFPQNVKINLNCIEKLLLFI